MGCPVHIWVPMLAAAAPFARLARDQFRSALLRRAPQSQAQAPRELKRWAPVGQAGTHEPVEPAR